MRTYKVIKSKSSDDKSNFLFTVPRGIGNMIGDNTRFECYVDDKGIHYTPCKEEATPAWAK